MNGDPVDFLYWEGSLSHHPCQQCLILSCIPTALCSAWNTGGRAKCWLNTCMDGWGFLADLLHRYPRFNELSHQDKFPRIDKLAQTLTRSSSGSDIGNMMFRRVLMSSLIYTQNSSKSKARENRFQFLHLAGKKTLGKDFCADTLTVSYKVPLHSLDPLQPLLLLSPLLKCFLTGEGQVKVLLGYAALCRPLNHQKHFPLLHITTEFPKCVLCPSCSLQSWKFISSQELF